MGGFPLFYNLQPRRGTRRDYVNLSSPRSEGRGLPSTRAQAEGLDLPAGRQGFALSRTFFPDRTGAPPIGRLLMVLETLDKETDRAYF